MSPAEAEELRAAVSRLLADPGPVVVGAAPGASCIGPAYEFAFELDHLLRSRRLRHAVPISFVTPEPHLGHMSIGKVGKLRQLLEGELEERDIAYHTFAAAVTKISGDAVEIGGRAAVAASPGLANPKGFVPVDARYRHPQLDGVYAVGVAVALAPAEETPVPVNFPKTGHMTEQMATIAARIRGGEAPAPREVAARSSSTSATVAPTWPSTRSGRRATRSPRPPTAATGCSRSASSRARTSGRRSAAGACPRH